VIKSAQNKVRNEESIGAINSVCRDDACYCGRGLGAAALLDSTGPRWSFSDSSKRRFLP